MTQSEQFWQEREQQMADAHAMEVEKLQERISWLEDELAARDEELAAVKEKLEEMEEVLWLTL